jgi:hypothetical protein
MDPGARPSASAGMTTVLPAAAPIWRLLDHPISRMMLPEISPHNDAR